MPAQPDRARQRRLTDRFGHADQRGDAPGSWNFGERRWCEIDIGASVMRLVLALDPEPRRAAP